ncbi:hypothetical protein NHQ30_000022 [Ciborinia camelliae]|nr:hypothetical protein NHQ30_000022 [Ciborinia camelliae]
MAGLFRSELPTRAGHEQQDEANPLAGAWQYLGSIGEWICARFSVRPAVVESSRRPVPCYGAVPGTLRPGLRIAMFQDLQAWGSVRSLARWKEATCLVRWGLFLSWSNRRVQWGREVDQPLSMEFFQTAYLAARGQATAPPVWARGPYFRERSGWPLFAALNHYF